MRAMLIFAYCEDAVFKVADVDKPEVKAGHVLVKVAASSEVKKFWCMVARVG